MPNDIIQVFIPAIAGHMPSKIVQSIREFMDCCYILRRSAHTEADLSLYSTTLKKYHATREIFKDTGVRDSISLPRHHSLKHYELLIQEFGSPNGHCSSLTESKHIVAVKEPWRRSNRNEPLAQMLETNRRLDQLSAARSDFESRGMLRGSVYMDALVREGLAAYDEDFDEKASGVDDVDDDDSGPASEDSIVPTILLAQRPLKGYPTSAAALSTHIGFPGLLDAVRRFLYAQVAPNDPCPLGEIPLAECPRFKGKISTRGSAVATFYAPSDQSSLNGMKKERIYAVPLWRGAHPRRDCIFTTENSKLPGLQGLSTARVRQFLSISHNGAHYQCALVEWFMVHGVAPDEDTSLWIVKPELNRDGSRSTSLIHLDHILRAAHLIPVFGDGFLPTDFHFSYSLDAFDYFYVNKYIDHHANEHAF
ncbi:hypothetical protein BOTBODRAFT_177952 [Botryobasidium botryosum FD-172 SS1]|uniref:Uncharacterized protein n=1 Tax=Botryobasidium botryosum (strain FD-172 SS1) TaxID=930990 RepID=A0A067MGF8_BOTB1|nr:hypothetical protein BOTBODRAFT_177952 [Botryobasidium botryosum FD-172 SS1]